jgi:hypothetical protein
MHASADRLLTRFPILRRAFVRGVNDGRAERLPAFLGLLMAAMDAGSSAPLCFLLPRRGEMARLAAVLYGLHRFTVCQSELTKRYAEINFTPGELVRIHPSRHVYCFLGVDPRFPDRIRLKPPNGGQRDWWSIEAAKFVPRLERTNLTRPIGRMNTPIHDPDPAPLDQLLGTSTFGNEGLFRNEVILLDSSAGFRQFVDSTSLQPTAPDTQFPRLKRLVPFGEVSPPSRPRGGWLAKWDERNPTGEPLVAVTSLPETLASYCIALPPRSKLVVVNGLSRIRDLQAYDDVQQTQRLVLFADDEEEELVEALCDRGCQFWELSRDEIELGEESRPKVDSTFGKLRMWARNKEELTIDAVPCDNRLLDEVSIQLESLRSLVDEERQGPATKLVARMWGFLNEAAAVVGPLSTDERSRRLCRLGDFRSDLQANRQWLKPEAERTLAEAACALEALLTDGVDFGGSKRAALEQAIAQGGESGSAPLVLVSTERQAVEIGDYLRPRIEAAEVRLCTFRSLSVERAVDRIICLSWPTAERLEGLARSWVTLRITLLGYPFERRWLGQFLGRHKNRRGRNRLGAEQKSALLHGCALDALMPAADVEPEKTISRLPAEDIWNFERRLRAVRKGAAALPTDSVDTVLARYVSFVGPTYAFLTETHRIVVATGLLSLSDRTQRLPERTVDTLKPGDFIVFPEAGDRELIQEKADQLLGAEAWVLRKTARLWKEALRSSGLTPAQFHKMALELGRPRHIVTIRNWFADTSQIGPGVGNHDLNDDLELIGLVTKYQPLQLQIPKVIESVKTLRSAHLSAGIRLRDVLIQRLPAEIGRIEEEGSLVDLEELGSAWIVQVESVASSAELRGRGEVNRLMWERRSDQLAFGF